jgi:hypothetical protein
MNKIFDIFIVIFFMGYTLYWLFIHDVSLEDTFDIHVLGELFIVWTIFSVIVTSIQIYRNNIFNRLGLAAMLFAVTGCCVYLINNYYINYYYNAYIAIIPFICIFITGIIATFCTPSGFIGELSDNQKAMRAASLKLLIVVACLGGLAFPIKKYLEHHTFYMIIPLLIIRWLYDKFGRQLRGEKSSWAFKW